MKLAAAVFNIVLFVFTCFILLSEGISEKLIYIVYSLLLLLIPVLNLVMIVRSRAYNDWLAFHLKRKTSGEKRKTDDLSSINPVLKIIVLICNIVLLGFSCWAFVNQYPHPKEEGIILYTVILFLTPILSSVAILRSREKNGQEGLSMKGSNSETG